MANVKANSSEAKVVGNPLSGEAAQNSVVVNNVVANKGISKQIEQELKALGGMGEDLADTLSANWQNLVVLLIVGIVAIVVFHGFGEVRQQNREETAKQFLDAQSSFASLVEVADKKLLPAKTEEPKQEEAKPDTPESLALKEGVEENKVDSVAKSEDDSKDKAAEEHNEKAAEGFKETITVLANSQGSSGYGLLANLYKAEAQIAEQQYEEARLLLKNLFGVKEFISSSERKNEEISAEGISLDLAVLLYARSLITEGTLDGGTPKAELMTEGVAAAKALAERGLFANVEALVILSRLGEDLFTREQLQLLAKQVVADHPEMRPQVEKDLPQVKL